MSPASRKNASILTIDDDKFIQKLIERALADVGYSTRLASNGNEGIIAALREMPDIILLDVEMPDINGYEVCTRLKEIPGMENVAVIFLSSHGSLRERLQGYEVKLFATNSRYESSRTAGRDYPAN